MSSGGREGKGRKEGRKEGRRGRRRGGHSEEGKKKEERTVKSIIRIRKFYVTLLLIFVIILILYRC